MLHMYKKNNYRVFLHNLLKKTQFGTLYAWNMAYRLLHYINIVYSKVLQFAANNDMTKQS